MGRFTKLFTFLALVSLMIAAACANRGTGPQGGPKDEDPPVLLRSEPANGELNFKGNEMELHFDEIVQVQGAAEKVVVSPPQQTPPIVKSVGKKVIVKLSDTLESNVSYTIDFGDAIVDNNEKNALESLSLSFATGDHIDSLKMFGVVLEAENLNPVTGIVVGIHDDMSDTSFTKKVFRRISKTDEEGYFEIRNIKPSLYKAYALQDIGSNYRFDFPNEQIAFGDSVYEPKVETIVYSDTLWTGAADSLRVDTIIQMQEFLYTPDSIVLFAFIEDEKRQYLKKSERKERYKFSLEFSRSLDSLPKVEALNFNMDSSVQLIPSQTMDTLVYWICDSSLMMQDTLKTVFEYPKTDSLGLDVLYSDTLIFTYRAPRVKGKPKKDPKDSVKRVEFINYKTNISSSHDYFIAPTISFDFPTKCDDLSKLRIEEQVDTLWNDISGSFERLDSVGLRYIFNGALKDNKDYRLVVDSAAFVSLEGNPNDMKETKFLTKSIEEYGEIKISVLGYTGSERVQLLDKKDNVISETEIVGGKVFFKNLMPGDYYMRLYIDADGNGKWTNGDYELKRQAEKVYYFPYSMTVRAFWVVEEEWDYDLLPIEEQKPLDLIQSKPKK